MIWTKFYKIFLGFSLVKKRAWTPSPKTLTNFVTPCILQPPPYPTILCSPPTENSVWQNDSNWCTITYSKTATNVCTSNFANEFYTYNYEIFTNMCHSKCSNNSLSLLCFVRSTLKSCSFPIHWPGEIKNSQEPPAARNFFFCNLFI